MWANLSKVLFTSRWMYWLYYPLTKIYWWTTNIGNITVTAAVTFDQFCSYLWRHDTRHIYIINVKIFPRDLPRTLYLQVFLARFTFNLVFNDLYRNTSGNTFVNLLSSSFFECAYYAATVFTNINWHFWVTLTLRLDVNELQSTCV